jgi:ATP-binding cassette, subfamily B, bacterial
MADNKAFLDLAAWRYFIGFFRPRSWLIVLSSLGSAALSLVLLPSLFLVRYLFDVAIPQHDLWLIIWGGVGIFALRMMDSAISLWLRAVNIRIINSAIFGVRVDLLQKLYGLSRRFHAQSDQKVIQARIVQDTERLTVMSNTILSRILPALLTSISLCLFLLWLHWFLVLVMISLFPLVLVASRHTMRVVKARVFVFQRAFESFSKGIWFVLRNMDLTRVQTAEDIEMARQTAIIQKLRDQAGRMSFIHAVHAQVQKTLTGFSSILILVIGGAAMVNSRMTIGEFLAFYVAAIFLYGQVDTITASLVDLVSGNESMATLHQLAGATDAQPYRGRRAIPFGGTIALEAVSFAYGRQPVLKAVDLTINSGSRIAIIGANGAGKSTAIELILGFYAPCQGRLCADGVPYDELDLVQLRRSIGVVRQSRQLFSGTILENLAYGTPDADRGRVVEACRVALADQFIEQLPDGYDTQIGEDGGLLSGGEGQRLAIARALLRRPRLLILDEPTNHLDSATVTRLMTSLDDLPEHPAILLVSHDRSVVAHAREVHELVQGELRPLPPAG